MKLEKLYIILFLSFIMLPTCLFTIIGTSTENTENRVTSEFPEFAGKTLNEFIESIDDFYTDNIPYKSDIVNIQKKMKINFLNEVDDPKVIFGKEGWLFYKGDDGKHSIDDYMKITRYNDEELSQSVFIFKELNKLCEKNGIKLIILIGPNKSSVYGEYMPNKYSIVNDENAAEQLSNALVNEGITVIYPKNDLKESKDYYTYYKYDTHWNDVGAFITSQKILEVLEMPFVSINDVKVSSTPRVGGDLAGMLAMNNDFTNDLTYSVSYKSDVLCQQTYNNSTGQPIPHTIYHCDDAESTSNLFYYGDSFATAITPFLYKNFNESTFMHRMDMTNEFIMPNEGDVIILETVERYTKGLAEDAMRLFELITLSEH